MHACRVGQFLLLLNLAKSAGAVYSPAVKPTLTHVSDVQVREGVAENTAQKMLDDFWSLQYLVPGGALNAFAGSLRSALLLPSSHKLTHALHLRFATCQVNLHTIIAQMSGEGYVTCEYV